MLNVGNEGGNYVNPSNPEKKDAEPEAKDLNILELSNLELFRHNYGIKASMPYSSVTSSYTRLPSGQFFHDCIEGYSPVANYTLSSPFYSTVISDVNSLVTSDDDLEEYCLGMEEDLKKIKEKEPETLDSAALLDHLMSEINESAIANFKVFKSQAKDLYLRLRNLDLSKHSFDLVGNYPAVKAVKEVGQGYFKTISLGAVDRRELLGVNQEKTSEKQVAYAKQKHEGKLDTMAALGLATELRMGQLLASKPEASQYIIKTYYIGIQDGKLHSIQKFANGGPVEEVLPGLSHAEKISYLSNVAMGLDLLHQNGVVHNDMAARNILVHKTKDGVKFLLSDLGICTFTSEEVNPYILTAMPPDICSPERYHAVANLVEAQKIQNTIAMKDAAGGVKLNTTPASDAFSFGIALCDAILRPSLKTDLNDVTSVEGRNYYKLYSARRAKWQAEYAEGKVDSALAAQDYEELKKMSPDLAELVKSLMSYDPNARPSLKDAAMKLRDLSTAMQMEP